MTVVYDVLLLLRNNTQNNRLLLLLLLTVHAHSCGCIVVTRRSGGGDVGRSTTIAGSSAGHVGCAHNPLKLSVHRDEPTVDRNNTLHTRVLTLRPPLIVTCRT